MPFITSNNSIFYNIYFWSQNVSAQTPNDPQYQNQNYLEVINVPPAWTITTGDTNLKIAIISAGGVYTAHEDLMNVVTVKRTRIGPNKRPPGTIGAGIIGAQTNNGLGIAGINWNSSILSYDIGGAFTDDQTGNTFYGINQSVIDDDIDAAIADGSDILFLPFKIVPSSYISEIKSDSFRVYPSFSRPSLTDFAFNLYENLVSIFESDSYHFTSILNSIEDAYVNDATIVAPVDDYLGVTWGIPNRLSRDHLVISVGSATELGFEPYLYSSTGRNNSSSEKTDIDLVAPGVNILTTSNDATNSYDLHTSTSAAAGQVAGVTSLLKSANPNLTPNDIREILRRTAVDIGAPGYDTKTGFGLIDAEAAFEFIENRSFTRGIATQKLTEKKIENNKYISLIHGPWGYLSNGTYRVDIYEVRYKISIPKMEEVDIWFRAKDTFGWDLSDPNRQRRHAFVEEINPVEGYAILKTYIYGDMYNSLGQDVGWGPADLNGAQIAYTIASRPLNANTKNYKIQNETITLDTSYDELFIDDNVTLSFASNITINSNATIFAGEGVKIEVINNGSLTANDATFRLNPNVEIEINSSSSLSAENTSFETMDGSYSPSNRWKHIKLLTGNNSLISCNISGAEKSLYIASSGNVVESGIFDQNDIGVYVNSGDIQLNGTLIENSAYRAVKVRGTGILYTDSNSSAFIPAKFRSNPEGINITDYGIAMVRHSSFSQNNYNVFASGNGDLQSGLYDWSSDQGYNKYLGAYYYDIYNISSVTAKAQYNWWGAAEAPSSSRFSGSVNVNNPLSCDPTINGTHCDPVDDGGSCDPWNPCGMEVASAGADQLASASYSSAYNNESLTSEEQAEKIKALIQTLFTYLQEHPEDPDNHKYIQQIHSLLTLHDRDGSIRQWAGFDNKIKNWRNLYIRQLINQGLLSSSSTNILDTEVTSESPLSDHVSVLKNVGQTAMLLEVDDRLREGSYDKTVELSDAFSYFVDNPYRKVSLLAAKAVAFERNREFNKALAVYEKIESIDLNVTGDPQFVAPDYSIVKEELADSMEARSQAKALLAETQPDNPDEEILPNKFELLTPYPNPFNPSTVVPFTLPSTSHVTIEVYDMLGRKVATLVDELYDAGAHQIQFDAGNLSSGVYFIRSHFNNRLFTKKVTLIK